MQDPSQEIATAIYNTIAKFEEAETGAVLAGVSMVLTTLIAELGMSERGAIDAFAQSLKIAKQRIKPPSIKVH